MEGLSCDLALYLPGIAPVLTFASLSVRPLFLSLIETHVTCLEPWAIRPALKAIILTLLPGLEEETSDDFEPAMRLINKFRDIASFMDTQKPQEVHADGQYFWQSLFLASITTPSRRLGVLAYFNRYLPKLGPVNTGANGADSKDTQELTQDASVALDSVILPEPGLLVRCFASGLMDENILVQRNFLDLLVTHLPLNSPVLQSRITKDDLERLVVSAVGVVIRRDMSLNRRLWAWLLGPEPDQGSLEASTPTNGQFGQEALNRGSLQSQYFGALGLKPLVDGLLKTIKKGSKGPSERARPFRISLSLMDRWEVGGFVVPAVFLPIVESTREFETIASSKGQFDEVFRSASAFFDGVESCMIFSELLNLLDWKSDKIEADIDKILHNLELARFILENFNVREEEMRLIHVPLLLLSALVKMGELVSTKEPVSPEARLHRGNASNFLLKVINLLVDLLDERAFKGRSEKTDMTSASLSGIKEADIRSNVRKFYEQSKNSLEIPPLPFAPRLLGELIARETYVLVASAVESHEDTFLFQETTALLVAILEKLPKSHVLRDRRFYSVVCARLQKGLARPSSSFFSVISSITSTVTSLYFILRTGYYVSYEELSDLVPTLVGYFWDYLSALSPKFHVEAVRCLWLLHSVTFRDHLVEASITSFMIFSPGNGSSHLSSRDEAERFFVLWNHSHNGAYEPPSSQINDPAGHYPSPYHSSLLERPLFIVLDLLAQGPTEASELVQKWLQDLSSIPK